MRCGQQISSAPRFSMNSVHHRRFATLFNTHSLIIANMIEKYVVFSNSDSLANSCTSSATCDRWQVVLTTPFHISYERNLDSQVRAQLLCIRKEPGILP